ncbi:MAG: hypothetical protein JSR45_13945 [Proteobacteria bacterium]|nr:hypothetical protein [Pseudomonadota bacterium]
MALVAFLLTLGVCLANFGDFILGAKIDGGIRAGLRRFRAQVEADRTSIYRLPAGVLLQFYGHIFGRRGLVRIYRVSMLSIITTMLIVIIGTLINMNENHWRSAFIRGAFSSIEFALLPVAVVGVACDLVAWSLFGYALKAISESPPRAALTYLIATITVVGLMPFTAIVGWTIVAAVATEADFSQVIGASRDMIAMFTHIFLYSHISTGDRVLWVLPLLSIVPLVVLLLVVGTGWMLASPLSPLLSPALIFMTRLEGSTKPVLTTVAAGLTAAAALLAAAKGLLHP